MGKSKKRVRFDSGRESDQIRTQAGIDANNVGAAIEAAIEQSNAEIVASVTEATTAEGEVEQTTPATAETGTAEQATPATAAPSEEPAKEPQTGACKPVPHWSASPSVEFRNANTEFLTIMSEVGTSEEDIKTTEEYILSQGSEEDALKIILTSIEQYKSLINKSNKEEQIMADNNTNPNNTASNNDANNNAAAMAAAMQNQAVVAAAPAAATGMTTTEKVVLYTAAGVAVVGLIVGVVALAKAAKANTAIANMGDGIM